MEEVLLVGERDLLASISTPSAGYQLLPRPQSEEVEETADRISHSPPGTVVLYGGRAGEAQAIRDAGTSVIEWPRTRFPVADDLFSIEPVRTETPRVFFSGPTSERRDRFLQPVKHRFDVLHLAAGADIEKLEDLMGRCTIAIDLAGEPGLPLVDRVGPAAAAGMLILAERPLDRAGLSEGTDSVGFSTPDELELLISDAVREPEAFLELRRAAREHAEEWRASKSIPEALAAPA